MKKDAIVQNSEDSLVAAEVNKTKVHQEASPEVPKLSIIHRLLSRKAFSRKRLGLALVGLLVLGGVGFVVMRANGPKVEKADPKGKDQVTPVTVTKVIQKTVPVQVSAIGKVQADATVSVTPQAGGRVTGVFFKKGQDVKEGDLLFTLDERSQTSAIQQARGTVEKSQAQVQQARATAEKNKGLVEQAKATLERDKGLVRQAEAVLAKDEAQAKFAQAQSDRYSSLAKQGAISQDQAQQYTANSAALAATLQADREAITNAQAVVKSDEIGIENANAVVLGDGAAIDTAQAIVSTDDGALNNAQVLASYTKIYAPIDGRAGNILVPEGNVVQANANTPLVIIQKIRPLQVAFSVPESNLQTIQKRMDGRTLKVDVTFAGNEKKSISGNLSFVNNTVDNATGTIQLIGDFDNTDGRLFPGQFVNATLTLSREVDATVVPSQAVQNGPSGQFVFLVKDDNTVENVPVTAIATIEGLSLIQKGVKPGDQVVTDGQGNLVTGSKISVKDESKKFNKDENADPNAKASKQGQKKSDTKPSDNSTDKASDKPNSDNSNTPPEGKKRRNKQSSESPAPAGGNP